jgi:hypothetical protein
MRRLIVVGLLAFGLSAFAAASARAVGRSDGRSCTTQQFGAVIQSLSAGGVTLKVAGQDRPVTFRLLPRTQVRKQDRPVGVGALAVGQKVVAEVRTCQGGGGPTEVALVSLTLGGVGPASGDTAPVSPPVPPAAAGCARGDFTAPVAVVGTGSISFTSNGAEGSRTFSVAVTGDTSIVKQGVAAQLSALIPGDRLHVWVVRCQGTPPTLRATKIVDLGAGGTPPASPPASSPPAGN